MSDQEATAAAIGGIPVPRALEDALLASAAAHDRMEGPDPLDTPAEAPGPVPLPGLEDLEPDPGIPTDRGAAAVEAYERARIAEKNRTSSTPHGPAISRGRALTMVREALIAAGYHPLVRLPLLEDPPGETCGSCAHLLGSPRTYRKCAKHRQTRAAETDVRISWPACPLWEARP